MCFTIDPKLPPTRQPFVWKIVRDMGFNTPSRPVTAFGSLYVHRMTHAGPQNSLLGRTRYELGKVYEQLPGVRTKKHVAARGVYQAVAGFYVHLSLREARSEVEEFYACAGRIIKCSVRPQDLLHRGFDDFKNSVATYRRIRLLHEVH